MADEELEVPADEINVLRREFLEFRLECIWVCQCYKNYADLFEAGENTLRTLGEAALLFFTDLNRVMIEYQWLISARILDPAITQGRSNLTVHHINEALHRQDLMTPAIAAATEGLNRYRDILRDGRNRLVAHLDLDAVLAGEARGPHAEQDVVQFYRDMQTYIDEVGNALGEGPLDIAPGGAEGDAVSLVQNLRR